MLRPSFGTTLRQFRTSKDVKLTWLAREAGVAPSHLSTLERGQRRARAGALLSITAACRRAGASADDVARLLELGVTELAAAPARRRRETEARE